MPDTASQPAPQRPATHAPTATATQQISRVDPHLHTTASDGVATPRQVLERAMQVGLPVIAITDHDTVAGALEAREIVAREHLPIEVIVGVEITAARGVHILALFLEAAPPMMQPVAATVRAIAQAGGICLAPHPLSPLTPSLGERTINALLRAGEPLSGVETINPSPAGRIVRAKVARCNRRWQLAEFGGSDAHFVQHIGAAYTLFPGLTAADFRQALLDRTTRAALSSTPVASVPLRTYARQSWRSMVLNPVQKLTGRYR